MAAKHGTRRCYVEGCRCDQCKEANTQWGRDYRARRSAGETGRAAPSAPVLELVPPEPAGYPGPVEAGVLEELEGLSQAEERPGLAQAALALARIMDKPTAVNQQPAAAAKLADLLDKLRKGGDARKSRLASVRSMTSAKSSVG